ncbi:hypothetical protein BJ912DRAFT_933856 [Pholiota molesta]|nr:hypothetical protein BJ912DRAFT_933856 [Pholiota molesta]
MAEDARGQLCQRRNEKTGQKQGEARARMQQRKTAGDRAKRGSAAAIHVKTLEYGNIPGRTAHKAQKGLRRGYKSLGEERLTLLHVLWTWVGAYVVAGLGELKGPI